MRLAKFLAHGGVASRRKAEQIVAKGMVTVDGEVVTDPARDVGEGSDVRVNGSRVCAEVREVWLVHKPAGVVSTADDPQGRPTVVQLVPLPGGLLAFLQPIGASLRARRSEVSRSTGPPFRSMPVARSHRSMT